MEKEIFLQYVDRVFTLARMDEHVIDRIFKMPEKYDKRG